MKRLLGRLLRALAATAAVVVILLALLVGLFRLLVPQVPEYQSELEAWASRAIGMPVSVARMDARWRWAGPELHLVDARVGGQGSTTPELFAREASVSISIARLLRDRQLSVELLRLSGVELDLSRDAQGGWLLQGRRLASDPAQGPLELPELPDFRLLLDDSRVTYRAGPGARAQVFDDLTLALARDGEAASLDLGITPPPGFGGRLTVSAEADLPRAQAGDRSLQNLDWRVSADAERTDLAAWSLLLAGDRLPLPTAGRGDLRLSLAMAGLEPQYMSARFNLSDLALPAPTGVPASAPYQHLAGDAEWRRHGQGWTVALGELTMQRGGRYWPAGRVRLDVERGSDGGPARLDLVADHLQLQELLPFAAWLAPSPLHERLLALDPGGALEDLVVSAAVDEAQGLRGFSARGELRDGRINAVDGVPGVSGLDGRFRADDDGGRFELAASALLVERPESFRAPLSLGRVDGLLVWRRGHDAWRLVGDDLRLVSVDVEARGHLEFALPFDGGPELDLEVSVPWADVRSAMRLLPVGHMPQAAVTWLDRALPAGNLRDGRVSVSGRLADFPFEDGEGRFVAEARVENATLDYADDWPVIVGIAGDVRFDGPGLSGDFDAGRMVDSDLLEARITIDNLRAPRLRVTGRVDSGASQLLEFLRTSPTRAVAGDALAEVSGEGPARLQLELNLPLADISNAGWRGTVDLDGVSLAHARVAEQLFDLRGELQLEDGQVWGRELAGVFAGEPFSAQLLPAEDDGYHTLLRAQGSVASGTLVNRFALPLESRIAGATDWQLDVRVPQRAGNGQRRPAQARLRSQLAGLHLQLPMPLGKLVDERRALEIELELDEQQGLAVSGRVDDDLHWQLLMALDGEAFRLRRGSLAVGGTPALLPVQPGFTVRGRVEQLDVDEWLELGRAMSAPGAGEMLQRVDLRAARVRGLGQEVDALAMQLVRDGDVWRLSLDSERLAGQVTVPRDLDGGRPLRLQMRRLLLTGRGLLDPAAAVSAAPAPAAPDPRRLPGMVVDADEFGIGSMHFGSLALTLRKADDGLHADRLATEANSFSISGEGAWLGHDDGTSSTRLRLQLSSSDVANTLRRLDYHPHLEAGDAEADIDVEWDGAPYAGQWRETIDGQVSVRVGSGVLSEVEPGAGRMFGLMSLSALPRRLALDFRDVFARGLTFDSISGDFHLVDGDAYTDNLRLRGPTADIGLVGRTGLADRDYEQQALVTADVGIALPAVGGLLAGPGVGAAILLFQEIFRTPLRGMGQAAYCVTGAWEAPNVQRMTTAQLEEGRLCASMPTQGRVSQ